MALSKSVVKAQNILLCQLCETDPKIKWKCVECQLLMCTNCRDRIHPKFKNAEEHEVLDLKEVRSQDEGDGQKLDFTRIRCKQHQGQVCCFYCSSCDILVCPSCILKSHTGHKFTEINEAYDFKIEHLRKSKGKLKKDKDDLTKGVQELNNLKTTEDWKCKGVIHKIQDQRAVLKQEIDNNADNLIKKMEEKLGKIQDSISGEKMKVEKTIKHLEDQTKMAESIINTTDVSEFFDEVYQIGQMLEEVVPPVNLTHKSMPKFVPGDKSRTAVGLLQDEIKKSDIKIQMIVNKEFSSEMKYIYYVSVSKDNSIWLGDNLSRIIQKVKLDESSLKPISTVNSLLCGMVVTPSGDLLFSDAGSTLKQISGRSGEVTNTIYSVAPLLVASVHMTYDNKIIVGAITPLGGKPFFPATGRRVVMVIDKTGKQEVVYENDNNNKRLFTCPVNVSSTRTGSIGVVDKLSSDEIGRVVVLLDRDVTGIYTGHPDINNKDKPFKPETIVATPSDNFIVTDSNTGNLHILDDLGHIITYYYNPGIKRPCSLSFSSSGQLYIGTASPKDSSYKGKVFIVDICGC